MKSILKVDCKGLFVFHCNAVALLLISNTMYLNAMHCTSSSLCCSAVVGRNSSMYCNLLQCICNAVVDRNPRTVTHCNADAVEYELICSDQCIIFCTNDIFSFMHISGFNTLFMWVCKVTYNEHCEYPLVPPTCQNQNSIERSVPVSPIVIHFLDDEGCDLLWRGIIIMELSELSCRM